MLCTLLGRSFLTSVTHRIQIRTDLVRFVIIGRVCKLLEPVKDSDIVSGGVKPHLLSQLFQESDLQDMLTDARAVFGHNSEIVDLL